MTVIIKSNQVATKSMGNIFGLIDAPDYSLLLDFNLGVYRKKEGGIDTQLTFEDAITFSRSTPATYLTSDNKIADADINEPRISYDVKTGKKGLLIEGAHTDYVLDNFNAVTQTVTVEYDANSYLVLKVKGSGSAVLSGAVILAEGSPIKATEGGSASYRGTAAGVMTITVTGKLEAISLQKATPRIGMNTKSFSSRGVGKSEADSVFLNQTLVDSLIKNKDEFTLVIKTIENELAVPGKMTGLNIVYSLEETTDGNKGIYLTRTTGTVPRSQIKITDGTGSTIKTIQKVVDDITKERVYAVSYSGMGQSMLAAFNGEVNSMDEPYTISVDQLGLGTEGTYLLRGSLNGIITQIVLYPYKMTHEQMEELTKI